MKKVFLAGAIDSDIQYAWQWRLVVTEELIKANFEPVNPLRDLIDTSTWSKYDYVEDSFIFRRDLRDLRNSDIILINLSGLDVCPSSTLVEIGIAHQLNLPMIGFGFNADSPRKMPLFVREMVRTYQSMDLALEALEDYYV